MNTQKLEQLLLLEQSGELAPKQRRQLDAELAASAKARQLREDLLQLSAAIPPVAAQPSPDAASRIDARLRKTGKPAFSFLPAWKPALAAAAALALLLGVRTYQAKIHVSPTPVLASATAEEDEWTDPLKAEFTELESLIATISSDDSLEITEI